MIQIFMKRIKIDPEDEIRGFYILLTKSSGICLPNNEYVVPEYILDELIKENVKFKIIENK